MKEAEKSAIGVNIEERRLEGQTFAQAILDSPEAHGPDLSQIPTGPEVFYEQMDIWGISRDDLHAIGIGRDEGKLSLIRDGQVVLSGDYQRFDIRGHASDYSKLAVVAKRQDEKEDLYLVQQNSQKVFGEARKRIGVLEKGDELAWVLLRSNVDGNTYFDTYEFVEDGVAGVRGFSVKGDWSVYRQEINDNTRKVVWNGGKKKDFKSYIFWDDMWLARGDHVDFRVSTDGSMVFTVSREGGRTEVTLNGVLISEIIGEFGRFVASDDLSLAVVEIQTKEKKDKGKSQLFVFTPEGVTSSAKFDELAELKREEGRVTAKIIRDGVQREIVISRDGKAEEEEPIEVLGKTS